MKILSVNAGSSSLKFQLYNMPEEKVCHNFDKTSAETHVYCSEYTPIEKVRYVWHLY